MKSEKIEIPTQHYSVLFTKDELLMLLRMTFSQHNVLVPDHHLSAIGTTFVSELVKPEETYDLEILEDLMDKLCHPELTNIERR